MPLSSRFLSNLYTAIERQTTAALRRTRDSILAEYTASADDIYDFIFVSHTPVTVTVKSDALARLDLPLPAQQVKLTANARLCLPNRNFKLHWGGFQHRVQEISPLIETGSGAAPKELVVWSGKNPVAVNPILQEVIDEAILKFFPGLPEKVERYTNLQTQLNPIPGEVCTYAGTCRSVGALYHRLPVLHSLWASGSSGVKHIRIPRLSPPPPPDLVQKLSILASLSSSSTR